MVGNLANLRGARAINLLLSGLLLAVTLIYLASAIAPFYANGIHLYVPGSGTGHLLDPKGMLPYTNPVVGGLFYVSAIISMLVFRFFGIVMAAVAVLGLFLRWQEHSPRERIAWITTSLTFATALILTWTTWDTLVAWLVDDLM